MVNVPIGAKRAKNIFIPAGILDYGPHRFTFTVRMVMYPAMVDSRTTFINITHSNVTANLVEFGTSIITNSYNKPLDLDPGSHSEDPDMDTGHFNRLVSHLFNWIRS